MISKHSKTSWLAVMTVLVVGCNANGPQAPQVSIEQAPGIAFASSHQQGNKSLTINLLPPKDTAFQTKAVVHRWLANDVHEYRVVLRVKQPSGTFVDFNPPLAVTCPQKGGTPVTQATFTDLKQGLVYQAELEAWGQAGGTAATQRLNTAAHSLATFDFSASNDVEDTAAASLAVAFDPVAFNGSGTVSVQAPAEGTFANPTADRPKGSANQVSLTPALAAPAQFKPFSFATFTASGLTAGSTYKVAIPAFGPMFGPMVQATATADANGNALFSVFFDQQAGSSSSSMNLALYSDPMVRLTDPQQYTTNATWAGPTGVLLRRTGPGQCSLSCSLDSNITSGWVEIIPHDYAGPAYGWGPIPVAAGHVVSAPLTTGGTDLAPGTPVVLRFRAIDSNHNGYDVSTTMQ